MSRPIVFSLASIPPRFDYLPKVLASLLDQTLPAARVVLTIPQRYRRFPDWDGRLPDLPPGVELMRCDIDLGPATKVLPLARSLRGQDVDLVYCDDDTIVPRHWLRAMQQVSLKQPGACIATVGRDFARLRNARRAPSRRPRVRWLTPDSPPDPNRKPRAVLETAGFADIALGHGGVMVRPDWFPDATFDIPSVIWSVDDIWLSGWMEVAGIPIWADPLVPKPRNLTLPAPLFHSVIDDHGRKAANFAAQAWFRAHYGIWPIRSRGVQRQ